MKYVGTQLAKYDKALHSLAPIPSLLGEVNIILLAIFIMKVAELLTVTTLHKIFEACKPLIASRQ